MVVYGDGCWSDLLRLFPNLFAVSKGMWAAELCSNKIPEILTWVCQRIQVINWVCQITQVVLPVQWL